MFFFSFSLPSLSLAYSNSPHHLLRDKSLCIIVYWCQLTNLINSDIFLEAQTEICLKFSAFLPTTNELKNMRKIRKKFFVSNSVSFIYGIGEGVKFLIFYMDSMSFYAHIYTLHIDGDIFPSRTNIFI